MSDTTHTRSVTSAWSEGDELAPRTLDLLNRLLVLRGSQRADDLCAMELRLIGEPPCLAALPLARCWSLGVVHCHR